MIVVGLFLGAFAVAGLAIAVGHRLLYNDLPPQAGAAAAASEQVGS